MSSYFHLLGPCRFPSSSVNVKKGSWRIKCFIIKQGKIFRGRFPVPMRSLLVVDQEKRFVLVPTFLQPFEGIFGRYLRHVPFKILPFAIHQEVWVVIFALPRQYH